ncbi:MAG: carbamoyltransferase HypF [Desulfomonile tiedjei]|nr:carbamoyltransferase HypF [Desulfomonile tiedjei]
MEQSSARSSVSGDRVRKHIVLTGILQGIGCRPTVYRLAVRLGLSGWVVNSSSGVHIEIEGTPDRCRLFRDELPKEIPFPGRIDETRVTDVAPLGESSFRIEASLPGERSITPIPPDVAICPACVEELLDAANPRYLYPFITCTLCGPRFTVVRSFPYDRERTSMADFTMCPRCHAEYETPQDRRFHSQTNSCPACGPRLDLIDRDGNLLPGDPVVQAVKLLMRGSILAVKGIGGFHLACNAVDEDAVRLLRERKGRAEKPFAVMMPDMQVVRRFCSVDAEEAALLGSAVAPIVLLQTGTHRMASHVAPFVGTLGVMLPYSGLHHLLFRHPDIPVAERLEALVMTSGNRSEEPIVRENQEALDRLGELADAFLIHNREIVLRADDSLFRVIGGRRTVFRRSRGLVPGEFRLSASSGGATENKSEPVVLAAGGDLKGCLAVATGKQVVPGPHVGDLAAAVSQEYFKQSIDVLTGYLEVEPELVAVDPHPEYFSSSLARELGAPVEEVFHHHAHAVSLLAEHGRSGPALFAVFDGTGFGTDATIWGGEFLLADLTTFSRMGHVGLFPLPGGEAAIREPVRILAGLLAKDGAVAEEFMPLLGRHRDAARFWLEAVRKGINSPMTSSAGRLFDAAAAAVGFLRQVTFEGQAAMWLEGLAEADEYGAYPLALHHKDGLIVDPAALILETARDILAGSSPGRVAARFHNTVASLVVDAMELLALKTGITTVGLTGGCFQNKFLTERILDRLRQTGFEVLLHESVPPNDGGIAIGQAVAARARLRRKP